MEPATNAAATPPTTPPEGTPRRRALVRLAAAVAVAAGVAGAAIAFLASESALGLAARVLIARSEGRLAIDEPQGSLLSTVRAKRIAWRGPDATATADDVALSWSPSALWSRGIVIDGLGAQRVAVAIRASDATAPLPASLALPVDVAIDAIAVGRLEWSFGTRSGTVTGITFGYAGSAVDQRIDRLALVTSRGTLSGALVLGASPPFALDGRLAFAGDATLKGGRADAVVAGTLSAVTIDAAGDAGDARFRLSAKLAPLAAVALDELTLDAARVDLSSWNPSLPATRIDAKVIARPDAGGLAGRLDAVNADAGPLDAQRVPVRSAAARFAWRGDAVTLDDIAVEVSGGGRATGHARIPLDGAAGHWTLAVRDVDLKRIHTAAAATRLAGAIEADLEPMRQRIAGDVADRTLAKGMSVAFAATVAEGAVAVERFHVRAGAGGIAGAGRVALEGDRTFTVSARAKGFDPSRFGDLPAGALDGEISASGALEPAWRIAADVAVAAGSKLAGVPVSGALSAAVSRQAIRDAQIDVKLGSAALAARGSAGSAGDRLELAIDAPRLAEIAPLLPAAVPRPLAGTLRARITLSGLAPDRAGIDLTAHGEGLRIGPALAVATLDARIAIAASDAAGPVAPAGARSVGGDVAATGIVTPAGTFARARVRADGTLAQHRATLAFTGEDLDVDVNARGGIGDPAADPAAFVWSGTIDALDNRGPWALRLASPAPVEIGRDRVRVGTTRIEVADGSVDLASLEWNAGRLATSGAFAGVPVATLARMAGYPLPFVSTLTLAGDWSLASTPRLNGTITVRREHGDFFLAPGTIVAPDDRAFRISALDLAVRVRDDAVDATATLRSGRGVNADAELALGVAPNAPPGRPGSDAPLTLALRAQLATLQVAQPWLGTSALVDGNLSAEVAARGTLRHAPLSGTVRAGALRIDAPEHGLHYTDGRLTATLSAGTVTLDELSLTGGAGRFIASGTLAGAVGANGDAQATSARIAWRAERFRVFNRPDRRLVASGSGTLAIRERKLRIDGTLRADEGHVEYAADARSALGDDVVVKGRPRRNGGAAPAGDFPLTVDLDLDFGSNLTFVGEGLKTGLAGRVRVTTASDGGLRGRGSIDAVNGTYRAFGQTLAIDRGRLIFDGPLDNPGLDIVALRRNLQVEAGVALSGTVKVPIIQLTSVPPVPDNEKLSWLVLGQGLDRTSGGDVAALQAASAALLGRDGRSATTTIAESVGLDDISVHAGTGVPRGAAAGTAATTGQVVTFGKRITDKLSLVYEQGLTVATNALRLEYALSRTLTLRAEAGAISGFGVYYRRVFE